ncbi:MAG: glutamate--tRNA ligase [Ruminococcaceae bacterium]|nr:glutamate--tRNA ligase [Oscillospiraceae bacterium]
MNFNYLAELLFPDVKETPEDMEKRFPARDLPEGAKVTRFAPSPTGFVHFGGLFPSTVGERLAHQSGGVFFLRIEDTDDKREIEGAAEALIKTLAHYGINFDEGAILDENGVVSDHGIYGPYKQSKRGEIYHVYAKKLVSEGKAYPCFTTEAELEALNAVDKKAEIKNKDWHEDAEKQKVERLKARNITIEEVEENLKAGNPFVLRLLADGDPEKRVAFTDLIKGKLEIPENDEDFVLLKSDGIPTYHFAHAVDDHLMGTTHVIRGEEWLPSLAKHLMLFRYLGFKLPKFLHIAQLMRLDENGAKKKLSKRDMGANMEDYKRLGYAPECVMEYVMTLLNSNFEEWHAANPDKAYTDFPFSIKKMSTSGCLFDFNKLNDVSKNVICHWSAEKVYEHLAEWAEEYDADFANELKSDKQKAIDILAIGRGGKKPRKDFAIWSEVKAYMGFFYDKFFEIIDEYPDNFDKNDIKKALSSFLETYDESDDMNAWFDKIKAIASSMGYAADMKEYKTSPESFKGNVADVSMFIRVAVTGKMNAPDLYTVMHLLGRDKVAERINTMISKL